MTARIFVAIACSTMLGACGSSVVSKAADCVFQPLRDRVAFAGGHSGSAPVFKDVARGTIVDITDVICTNTSAADAVVRRFILANADTRLLVIPAESDTIQQISPGAPIRVSVDGLEMRFDLTGTGECLVLARGLDLALSSDGATIEECGI